MKTLRKFLFFILITFALSLNAQQSVTYFYVATAVDNNGLESSFSNEVTATVSGPHPTVDLSWIASVSTSTVGYNVYRSKVSGSYSISNKLNASLVTGLTFTDTTAFPSPPTMNKPTVP